MTRLSFLAAFLMMVANLTFAQNRSVNFEHITFQEALEKAKVSNKLLFFDGYTSWCGPCKYMATKIFTQDKVADFFNEQFINVKFDMEKGEGVELAKRYGIKAFPTFLILDAGGNVQHRIVGGDEADAFIERVKAGLDPGTSLAGLKAKYDSGDREPMFIVKYLNAMKDAYMTEESESVAKAYINSLKETQRTNKENWNIFNDFVTDPHSKEFMFILTNRRKFIDAVGDSSVNAKISAVFLTKSMALLVNRRGQVYSKEEAAKIRNLINISKPKEASLYGSIIDLAEAKSSKNGSEVVAIAVKLLDSDNIGDQMSYTILSNVVPVVLDYGTKNDLQLLGTSIDSCINRLKNDKAKSYFENLKKQVTDKM